MNYRAVVLAFAVALLPVAASAQLAEGSDGYTPHVWAVAETDTTKKPMRVVKVKRPRSLEAVHRSRGLLKQARPISAKPRHA